MAEITIGEAASLRAAGFPALYTLINKGGPASGTGWITSAHINSSVPVTGLRVGTFYLTGGNTLKCRDSVVIGDVPALEQTITEDEDHNPLAIVVQTGDYFGCYYATGNFERDTSGQAGLWLIEGEYIDPTDEAVYTLADGDAVSLGGIGSDAPPLEPGGGGGPAVLVAAGII